jgi:hypothetical protein
MGASSKELYERYEATGAALRKSLATLPERLKPFSPAGQGAVDIGGKSLGHAEAVVAVLLDAVERYTDAAARDREAQAKNRRAQKAQTWAMVFLTSVIAVSTALYTYAAFRPAHPTMIAVPTTEAVSSFPQK